VYLQLRTCIDCVFNYLCLLHLSIKACRTAVGQLWVQFSRRKTFDLHWVVCNSISRTQKKTVQSLCWIMHARFELIITRCFAQRGLCCRKMSVCLSVCHTRICRKGSKYHQTFFSPSSSHTTLLLAVPYKTLWQYSDGDPLTGRRTQGSMKKSRFSNNISLYLRNGTALRDGDILLSVRLSARFHLLCHRRPPPRICQMFLPREKLRQLEFMRVAGAYS